MRLSLLQPRIRRGDIEHNIKAVQTLIRESKGDLLVLPEYVLTGSLVLDKGADIHDWAVRSEKAKKRISVLKDKHLLINTLVEIDGKLYNCCELLPEGELQLKLFPDETELSSGILPGTNQKIFNLMDKRFKVLICSDIRQMDKISTDGLDFLVFVYHFTEENFERVISQVKAVSKERHILIVASSLVSDKNNGRSSIVAGEIVASLSDKEGILEIEL